MEQGGYQGGGTAGGKWGCGLAAVVSVPLLGGALQIAALGQCADDNQFDCIPHWQLFAGAILIIATVNFGTRAPINTVSRQWRNGSLPTLLVL